MISPLEYGLTFRKNAGNHSGFLLGCISRNPEPHKSNDVACLAGTSAHGPAGEEWLCRAVLAIVNEQYCSLLSLRKKSQCPPRQMMVITTPSQPPLFIKCFLCGRSRVKNSTCTASLPSPGKSLLLLLTSQPLQLQRRGLLPHWASATCSAEKIPEKLCAALL